MTQAHWGGRSVIMENNRDRAESSQAGKVLVEKRHKQFLSPELEVDTPCWPKYRTISVALTPSGQKKKKENNKFKFGLKKL